MKYILAVLAFLFYSIGMQGQVIQAGGPTTFCAGENVVLTVNPITGISAYQWTRSGANVGTNTASYTVNTSGSYSVKLTRTSLPDTIIGPVVVTVNALPAVTVTQASICTGQSATLTASGADTYTWTPATGLSAITGSTVTANPAVTTTYTVTGKKTSTGCSKTAASTVTVNSYPVANFTFAPSGQCSNVPVVFTNTSSGGTNYSWDFGDPNSGSNNSSNAQNPSHTFIGTPGNGSQSFSVVLTVTNAGCSDTKTLNITNTQIADGTLGGTGKVTYNGQTYFTTCGLVNGDFTFTNQSVTPGTNTSYQIVWGDGSPDFSGPAFSSTTHTYAIGSHPILFIVTGENGCVDTTKYYAFVGTNPAVGLNNPGNTLACSGESLTFPITGVSTNAPGTVYTVTFNDGTPPIVYIHPDIPASITHVFDITSCGTTSSNGTNFYANSFSANIVAANPCNSSAATVVPIYISKKPKASFGVSPKDSICINTVVTLTNTSQSNFVYNGTCLNGNAIWSITPATGWNIISGSLGNDFGLTDPSVWQTGSDTLLLNFSTPGVYTIKIKSGNNNCGVDSTSRPVCITTPPVPSFTLNSSSGCLPFNVTATNTTTSLNSCAQPVYLWSVAYTPANCGNNSSWDFAPGSSATSTNPVFIFNEPGIYTIILEVTNECGTYSISHEVNVRKPPTVTITPPTYPCGPVTITPIANVNSCGTGTLTYKWKFAGGIPDSSIAANPGPVKFSGVGSHAITLEVTNDCGTANATESVTVTTAPDVIVPANQNKCGGETVGPLNFSSMVGTPVYNWTNSDPAIGLASSGTGNIPSFTATNNGTIPITATVIVTPFVSAACSGISDTFTITVNPRPVAPLASSPIIYCRNAVAMPLSATAAGGNTLTWYTNPALTGGTTTVPTPATSTPGNTLFYVTQTNSFICASPAAIITVTVNPSISGNAIAIDQNICANTIPATLTTLNAVGGGSGSYDFQWQNSTDDGVTWINIPGTNNEAYSPPSLPATMKYRRIINSSICSDTSNLVTITVQGALANYDISASQIVCEGSVPALLTGEIPTGGGGSYSYTWESSTDNTNWSPAGASTADYQPPAILQTSYFRRKVNASQCAAVSAVVTITVNPKPNGNINIFNSPVCEYEVADISFNATAGSAPFNIELKITSPGGTTNTLNQNISGNGPATINVVPANSTPGIYTVTLTKITDGRVCERTGNISMVSITVKPRPDINTSAAPTICSGNSTLLTVSGADSYSWTPASGLSSTSGNTVTANPTATTTYTITGTLNGCFNTTTLPVTVTPGATVASTGPAQVLCNSPAATLDGNTAGVGTGSWQQFAGPAALITAPSQTNTIVTGLMGGQRYIFKWSITGLPPCPSTSANDTIDVLAPIINEIKNDTIICSGQSVLLETQNLSGGNTNSLDAHYSYLWETVSPGQSDWQLVPNATDATLMASPTVSTCYRRKVKSNNSCETISNIICIIVNPNIGNNTISATQEPCVNVSPTELTGTIPNGGDNNYVYQWQTGIDGINWTDIGSNINYQPAAYSLAGMHYFRRNVTSGNCTAVSNVITITVRPDSKAMFTANPSIACSPFDLATAINVTALPDSNGIYQWYADGVLFGSNNSGIFPGYNILNPADTVIIKLKTTSQYGCEPDSIEQQFVTLITAQAKFSKDTSFGCGPLAVGFMNTSSLLNGIQFFWDFGNGKTSTLIQPGTIIFDSSPFFDDTTYQISLKAYNGCDTTIWRDSVKLRPNPKARFGVDTTFGCSPFTIQVNNTSPGGLNTYYWDFGNGVKDTTFINGIFNYTYNTGNAVDTFTIRLIAENQCSRDTGSINVRVAPNPIRPLINVNSSELFGCTPHIVSFNNNTSGATGYTWNFGDNTPPLITNNNQTTVVHSFDSAGSFTVSIDITNGCSDTTVFRQVNVFAKPLAAFSTSAPVYCEGDTIKVINNSADATNYGWFWGDGSISGGVNPVHVYAVAGNYNILLQAQRTNGSGIVCMDTVVMPVIVLAKPVVTVQSNINAINCAPFTLNVSAPGIINESVAWYFYDSTVTPSVITTGNISSRYVFNKPGSFYVKLVAVNAQGCTDSTIIPFTVRGKAIASFTPFDQDICTRDTTVNYLNTSSYNGIDRINYQWLVDNVLISTGANFTHRYNVLPNGVLPRVFNTMLIVSNTVGCSDTASATLQMNPSARAQFSITNPNECAPFKPVIVNSSTYTSSYQWLLNGNEVSNEANPDIAITRGSTLYSISLIAGNIYGCKPDTFTVNFTSRAKPEASFLLSDTLGCTGQLSVGTTNLTTGANSYIWNWGDGTANSFLYSPTYLYTIEGQYLITLVASDGVCADTTEQLVKVSTSPEVDFSLDQTLTCDTAKVQFTNLTKNGTGFTWTFGDGTFSNETNPSKSFPPNTIPYTVKLVASGNYGCKDSSVKANLVTARVPPASDFFTSPSPVITVPNYTFNFNNLTLNSNNYKYLWSLGDGSFATTRDVTHKYADTGNYSVRLIVLDTVTNCIDTTIKIVRIDGFPGYLYVPNAICPACTQTNLREFLPKGAGLKEYRLQIYTTWNELIFETRVLDSKGTPTQAWDGKFKGAIVQQDVYVWRIDAKFLNGSEWTGMIYPGGTQYKKVGTITVIK